MYLGIPQCTTNRDQLTALNDLLQSAKPHWASFGSDTAKDMLAAGDVSASMIWSGVSAQGRKAGANFEYIFPKEGYVVWMDNIVLLKDAPNRKNALTFMNWTLRPEIAAAITNFNLYSSGVMGVDSYLSDEAKNSPESFPPEGIVGEFVQTCEEEVQDVYDKIWVSLKK